MRLQRARKLANGAAGHSGDGNRPRRHAGVLGGAAYVVLAVADTWLAGSTSPTAARARLVTKPLLMPALHLAFRAAVASHDLTAPGATDTTLAVSGQRPVQSRRDTTVQALERPAPQPGLPDRWADRLCHGTAAGQALSWTGDVALLGASKNAFLAGVAGFAGAHVAYLGGFLAARDRTSATPANRLNALLPLMVWAALTPVMVRAARRREPELAAPVGGYATLLSAMFAASLSLDPGLPRGARRTVQAGTTLFVVSDSLLATQKFLLERERPAVERLVMATYTAGQGLIALGLQRILTAPDRP